MAAILGLDAQTVIAGCAEIAAATGEVVSAANLNDPKQTVIAGTRAGVDRACERLKEMGAKRALPLSVSAPFHTCLMKPAAERLRERLARTTLRTPAIAVINNIDVIAQFDPEALRDALYRQAFGPVRWVETVEKMVSMGVTTVVECGPGKVLAGLVKRIAPQVVAPPLFDPASLRDVKALLA
jgi:[acyl-carrier-protein] S-malonyltransferase